MKKSILGFLALTSALSMYAADADPVLMTIDGKPVRVSEFEYLYNKNNTQQLEPQTLDDYLTMFVNYKLKVADAMHQGLDKTDEFLTEYNKFAKELAEPYLRDQNVAEALVEQAYGHFGTDVLVSHIMLPLQPAGYATLDSLRTAITAGTTTFEDAARQYSIDRYSAEKGGLMGYVVPGRFPWAFEEASYDTSVGDISPIINSGMGYHIIRVESATPAQGTVEASHILILTRDLNDLQAQAAKEKADSIYNLAIGGEDFADLARRFSQDPGSATNGGELGYFGRGAMVAEFDSAVFALADGEISRPVKTQFGYHIIHRTGHKDVPSLDQLRKNIEKSIASDSRSQLPRKAVYDRLRSYYNVKMNPDGFKIVNEIIDAATPGDTAVLASIVAANPVLVTYDTGSISAVDALARVPQAQLTSNAKISIEQAANALIDDILTEKEEARLAVENTEFRNLINEYHDGILLYEVSNRTVWDKAAKDRDGLERYFHANADKYRWDSPKFKSFVIFAPSDSVLRQELAYAQTLNNLTPTEFVAKMRDRFKRDIKIERVVAAKGENPITDYLGFGEAKPDDAAGAYWKSYAAYKGRLINAPEEASDVRGAALTDYQGELDAKWIDKLHKQYKVKINDKVFKALKKSK